MECSFCGRNNDAGSSFCSGCGKTMSPPPTSTGSNALAGRKKSKTSIAKPEGRMRIPSPDGKLDSRGNTLLVHADGTIVNNKYSLYYLTAGGMGAIYLAEENSNGNMYIIKEAISSDHEEQLMLMAALIDEKNTLIRLNHPHIIKAYDYFIDGGAYYLVLEFVDGQVLEHMIQQNMPNFFSEETVTKWAIQIADALDYLHNQDPPIIYRDLKPDNIMVTQDNNIKVIDFGATRVYKEGKERDTKAIGTAGFAAPEQYGSSQTDARADIYSLGATMHYALTNRYPGDSPFVFPLIRSINPRISDRMDIIVQKAVQPDMSKRYLSAYEFKMELMGTNAVRCPSCSTVNRPDYTFCKKCGKKPQGEKIEKTESEVKKIAEEEVPDLNTKKMEEDISPKPQEELSPSRFRTATSSDLKSTGPLINRIPRPSEFEGKPKTSDPKRRSTELDSRTRPVEIDHSIIPESSHKNQEKSLEKGKDTKIYLKPFVFENGKEAHDLNQFIDLCRKYPKIALKHLSRLEFTPWLKFIGVPDYGLEEGITSEVPQVTEYELVYFCVMLLEFLDDMKSGREISALERDEIEELAKKHNLLSIMVKDNIPEQIFHSIDQSELILIPEGEFWMGKEGGKDNPRHKVYINGYYIDKLPVTNIQYEKFVRETKYQSEGDWRRYYTTGASNYPVTCVTWKDAVEYLNWAGKRLPTEAEWEKAATGTEERLYPWGNTWDPNKCNNLLMNKKEFVDIMCNMEDRRGTIPVGSIASGVSVYGIEDLAGNSWEWCTDWYDKDYYYHGPEDNPKGPPNGKFKVTRGGYWKANYPYFFECSFRAWLSPKERMGYCGFRGVKDID